MFRMIQSTSRALAFVAVAVMSLLPGADALAGQVLGADAAAPIKAWTGKLAGLTIDHISIDGASISVVLDSGCTLWLDHASAARCKGGAAVGNATACWDGAACPAEAGRAAALAAAGKLELPWRETSSADAAPGRDAVLAAHEAARGRLAVGDLDRNLPHYAQARAPTPWPPPPART